jgi:adenylate cyclase
MQQLSITQQRKLRSTLKITIPAILIALIYPAFADGFTVFVPFLNSFVIGLVGGLMVSYLELVVFDPLKKQGSFLKMLALKTFIYFTFFAALIPLVMCFNESIFLGRGFLEHFRSEQFQNFLWRGDYDVILFYSFIFIGIIIFVRQINRKLGQGVLLHYLFGHYHEPHEVKRIFLHLDIRSSTTIAEELGGIRFHQFLNEFFLDVTNSILATRGVIYDYVGDQIVVTWTMTDGLRNANCLIAYFHIKNTIHRLREKYLQEYGFVPRFSTSYHCGRVIVGELGDVKSQLVYQGEVLFQTTAIEKLYRHLQLQEQILLSEPLLERLKLPKLYRAVRVGEIADPDQGEIAVYTLEEKAVSNERAPVVAATG